MFGITVVLLIFADSMVTHLINQEAKAIFFVATDGNDTWSGKLASPNAEKTDGPFATLVRARDAVREIKTKEGLKGPVTVMVRGGKYFLEEMLVFGSEDSGTQDCPITYTTYPGEKPILSGGRKITNWKPYKGKILQCELPGVKGGTCLRADTHRQEWKFRQLFFNGERQIRARTPNFDPENPLYGGWAFVEGAAGTNAFKYKPGTFKYHWSKPTEAEVNINPGSVNFIVPIKTIDEERYIITVGPRGDHHYQSGNRFIVENVLEELDQPGEWCLDSEDGILYFWPPDDSIESEEVVAPMLDCLIDLQGVSHITISGFTFTETSGGDSLHHECLEGYGAQFPMEGLKYCGDAVHLKDTEHCYIEKNYFHAVGGNAIYLEGYNARNLIQNNEISYAGTNGVCFVGTKERNPMFNRVLDNHIHHCGVINKYVAGVFLGVSEGNVIGHNYIHHMPHHAINLGSNGFGRNIVEYNEIRHSCLEIHDTGAINCWMDVLVDESYIHPYAPGAKVKREAERAGHIIRYNFIADTWGCRVDEEGNIITPNTEHTFCIYLDNCSSNCFVYGNIIVRSGVGISVHNGKNNIVENNIFVNCKYQHLYCDGISSLSTWSDMKGFLTGNRFCRNIAYSTDPEAALFRLNVWTDRVVEQSDYNLFFNAAGKYTIHWWKMSTLRLGDLVEWQKLGYDRHSMTAEPLFVDLEHDDYRLRPESPAFKLGFQPIDLSMIGPRGEQQ